MARSTVQETPLSTEVEKPNRRRRPTLAQIGEVIPPPTNPDSRKRQLGAYTPTSKNNPANWAEPFLENLRNGGVIKYACQSVGITRDVYNIHFSQDLEFRRAVEVALEDSVDVLEATARKRAVEYSDTLLIFLLKGLRPSVFGERVRVTNEVEVQEKVQKLAEAHGLETEQVLRLAEALAQEFS